MGRTPASSAPHSDSTSRPSDIRSDWANRYALNIWDVGGQKTIRSYWRNYFEQMDGLVWVVDSLDVRRLDDCKMELHNLLKEERLAGLSLLIFANKQDIQGALKLAEIAQIILGSQSIAWRNILAKMGYEFTTMTADINEKA